MRTIDATRAILIVLTLALGGTAAAQAPEPPREELPEPEEAVRARALFEEGLGFADRGDWQRAVHRFRSALELHPSDNIRFNLAQSLVHMGRILEAIEELALIHADAEAAEDMRRAAAELRALIEPRLGQLVVDVRGAVDGAQVIVDGRPLARLGVALPIDPGVRVARLLRGAIQLDVEEVDVPAGRSARVILEAPPLPTASTTPGGSDDAWIWGIVIGAVALAAGVAIAVGVVASEQGPDPSAGDFLPAVLEID